MGCIMTPMPNHLSTHLSLFHHNRVVGSEEMSGVEMRRMDEMVRMRWCELWLKREI